MKKLFSFLIIIALIAGAGYGGYYYYQHYLAAGDTENPAQRGNRANAFPFSAQGLTSATGITVIGLNTEEFRISKLDTELEIEEVYLRSGDTVSAGTPILKLKDDCVEEALKELNDNLANARLDCRSQALSFKEAELSAKYDYDSALLAAEQAEEVYQEALADAEKALADAVKKVEDSQKDIAEYTNRAQNFSDYKEKGAGEYENKYDELKALFSDLCNAWGYDKSQIQASSASSPGRSTDENASDEKYQLLKRMKTLIEKIDDAFVDKYDAAIDSREDAFVALETELAAYADYEAELIEAQANYQIEVLSAKQDYDLTLAKKEQAKEDYDTAMKKAQDSLDSASEALEDAEEALQEFADAVGDGILRTGRAGEIVMVAVEAQQELEENSLLLAFADKSTMQVSASVSQEDIAGLTLGEKAEVSIEDGQSFTGSITEINPVSNSSGRTNITYAVTITLDGDVSSLNANQTATVLFGGEQRKAAPSEEGKRNRKQ